MIVPGLPTGAASSGGLQYSADTSDVNLFTDTGSPAGIVAIAVLVNAGVIISSSSTSIPAMDGSGFAAGSSIELRNLGRIQGMGGQGGRGQDGSVTGVPTLERGGGGGGGAGTNVGAGGIATSPATAGSAGTATAGGAGGTDSLGGAGLNTSGSIGFPGGVALASGAIAITIENSSGEIWGGGGGGGGGILDNNTPVIAPATTGGVPGQGGTHSYWGTSTPGNAVSGTAVTFSPASGGTSPQLEGPVG